jgi:hypothetical protein
VIDGQHRLEAAKSLKTPIYYITGYGLTYKDAGILNACTDDWEFKEFLDAYMKNGHEEYIRLDRFKREHELSLKRFLMLMSREQKKIFDETFKIGTFYMTDKLEDYSIVIKKIESLISYLEGLLLIENKRFIYTDNFWRALHVFLTKQDIDIERLKEKVGFKYQSIRPMSGYKDYLKTFTEIYNWKAKQRIEALV